MRFDLRIRAALVAALCFAILLPPSVSKAASAPGGVEVVGKLPSPIDEGLLNQWIVGINDAERRMYYLWRKGPQFYLREYDLRPDIPRMLREVQIATYEELLLNAASPYNLLLDDRRDRMLLLGPTHTGSAVRLIDIKKLEVIGTWDLTSIVPGFIGQGMTYSPKDQRIYIVGVVTGSGYASQETSTERPGTLSAVVAIDARSPANGSPKLAWARVVPECQYVLNTQSVGALIARSTSQKALYFACARPDPYPGESGLVRMWIDPKGDLASAQDFKVDFFPVSGSYNDARNVIGLEGMAAFDPATNRFFMHSVARATPGTWVFDGDLSAWVGFIAAPDDKARYIGLDPGTGHFYMGSDERDNFDGYGLVSNARATPVPQGDIYTDISFRSFAIADPSTDRFFAVADPPDVGLKGDQGVYMVFRDHTPTTRPPRPPDYDALTADIPEGPNTVTSYSAGANGYGARAVLVGGYGGALSILGEDVQIGQVRPGDRGITAARVPSLDLREVGASATAQAYIPDGNTEAEVSDGLGQEWPWGPASCLDGSGTAAAVDESQNGGEAHVRCDLAKQTARATATSSAFSQGGVDVGASFFDSVVRRDPEKGAVTQAIAISTGLRVTTPAGSMTIDRVEATATTFAHGRPKTNNARWERLLFGIELRDTEGNVVQRVPECSSSAKEDTCDPIIDRINDVLKTRARIDLPRPALIETPRGAFAAVQQTDADFYQNRTINNQGATFTGESGSGALPALQVTVLNDTVEKSRLIVQLAAIQASSIYTISPEQEFAPSGGDLPVDVSASTSSGAATGPSTGLSGAPSIEGGPANVGDVTATAAEPIATTAIGTVTAYLPRSLPEALLFAGFWSLFGGAGWMVVRRRSLLSILGGTK